ncbi:MAG: TetR family transcriptional regulator, partial [Spirochaetota bacterium]|nr:TetR family transcriptional regulator [Spirochaetota bacterium]
QGYKETSIREIAKAAGVNVSMISYYFGGKSGILKYIVKNVTEGFASILSQFELTDVDAIMIVLKRFLEYLEDNRPQIKILFSEMGKGSDYIIPVKEQIIELQVKLGNLTTGRNNSGNNSELTRKLKILTDILLGVILSDYIFDFSSFQGDIHKEEKKLWREDRIEMLIKILKQLSGLDSGELTFESIF